MADTIEIAGHRVNKWLAYGGGGLAVVVLIVLYRKHQAAAASSSSSAPPATSPSNIDPATGFPYGSPEDQAALASMGSGYGAGFYPGGGGSPGPLPGPGGGGFTTNAQWAQAAEAAMGSNGTDAIAAALGHYLTGTPVDQGGQQLIEEAVAIEGYPPVNGPNGFPPSINLQQGGGTATNPVTGLHITKPGTTGVDVAWNASTNATGYQVTATAGTVEMTGPTSARIRSINPAGHPSSATVTVLATPAAANATPATITVHTSK